MMQIRPAALADIDALFQLELASFASDRLSRRQFRYMLTRAHAQTLIAEADTGLLGYVLVLFSRATSVARLYSIAVAGQARGQGVGRALVTAAEKAAWAEDRSGATTLAEWPVMGVPVCKRSCRSRCPLLGPRDERACVRSRCIRAVILSDRAKGRSITQAGGAVRAVGRFVGAPGDAGRTTLSPRTLHG